MINDDLELMNLILSSIWGSFLVAGENTYYATINYLNKSQLSVLDLYSIQFTIAIGVIFFVYGKNDTLVRKYLLDLTRINSLILIAIFGFALSMISLPKPIYILVHLGISIYVSRGLYQAFRNIRLYFSGLTTDRDMMDDYLVKEIKKGIKKYLLRKEIDNKLNSKIQLSDKICRYVSSDKSAEYTYIYAKESGWITDINIKNIPDVIEIESGEAQIISKNLIYISPDISIGAKISEGSLLWGYKTKHKKLEDLVDIKRTKNNIFYNEEYLWVILNNTFLKIFDEIQKNNIKSADIHLDTAKKYIEIVSNNDMPDDGLISRVNGDFIRPLQEESFKKESSGLIRIFTSISYQYLLKSVNQESKEKFKIFLQNLDSAFLLAINSENKKIKNGYIGLYNQWTYELVEYKLFRKRDVFLEKDFLGIVLVSINFRLKSLYFKDDIDSFNRIIALVKSLYENNLYYDFGKEQRIKLILPLIFGLTSCIHRDVISYNKVGSNKYKYIDLLVPLFDSASVNEIISLAEDALSYSEKFRDLGWDNLDWNMSSIEDEDFYGPRSGMITTQSDIVKFLSSLLVHKIKKGVTQASDILSSNELIANMDLVKNIGIDSIYTYGEEISAGDWKVIKNYLVEIFDKIKQNYNTKIEQDTISQPIIQAKINEFAIINREEYKNNSIVRRFSQNTKIDGGKAFGYSLIFPKDEFIETPSYQSLDRGIFGEGLAKSENNIILKGLKELKGPEYKQASFDELGSLIKQKSSKYDYAILWTNSYLFLDDYGVEVSNVQDTDKGKQNLYGFVGKMGLYSVFANNDTGKHDDCIIFFNKGDIAIDEYLPNIGESIHSYEYDLSSDFLKISIVDLTSFSDEELNDYIEKNPKLLKDKIKSKVVLNLYRGSSLNRNLTKIENIEIFNIE